MNTTFQDLRKGFNLFKFNTKLLLGGAYFTLLGKKTKKFDGVEILVPYEFTDIWLRGQIQVNFYEKRERRHLKKYLEPESSVLELGGCLGVVSCVTNRLLRHPERHVVVEANPKLVPWIEKNKAHTGSSFTVENCILSNRASNEFYIGPNILESSTHRKWQEKITVTGKTVDDLERAHGLKFDTLIMDIEGAELNFLRENRQWLRQLHTVILEIHPGKENLSVEEVAECRAILETAGLQIKVVDGLIWVLKRTTAH